MHSNIIQKTDELMGDIEKIIREMSMKDAKALCREVMSINDTMDVLRSKWVVEILSAILYGSTRFKTPFSGSICG